MLKFNNDNIFTGYLKQLLASFNLPKYKIYTKEQAEYFKENNTELNVITTTKVQNDEYPEDLRYTAYIKDNKIQHCIKKELLDGSIQYEWQPTNLHYHDNKKELNYTKSFQIKNNIYDSYTHEYLGDFLRFFRDYYDLDLMPLYNCFSNQLCTNLNLSFKHSFEYEWTDKYGVTKKNEIKRDVVFDSRNKHFKIYMLPVKLFKEYTIAIDSSTPIEICCSLYDAYLDPKQLADDLANKTYMKLNKSNFNTPFVYDKLAKLTEPNIDLLELAQNEHNIKLFIKVPQENRSSIAILEGNYIGYNDSLYDTINDSIIQNKSIINFEEGKSNHSIINNEGKEVYFEFKKLEDRKFSPISKLQLLAMNTGVSYPFAERLIEFLSGNAITNLDSIADNITRVQTILNVKNINKNSKNYKPNTKGLWDDKIRFYVYDFIMNAKSQQLNYRIKHDLLGYIDKDSEANVTKAIQLRNGTTVKESISKVDIYPNLYNNTYMNNMVNYTDSEDIYHE